MFKHESKYQNMDDYIAKYPNSPKLKTFEERLKELTDQRFYSIYMIRFYERTEKGKIVSVAYISEKTGIDQRRVIECLNSIQICFEVYCLKDLQEKMKEEKEMLKE